MKRNRLIYGLGLDLLCYAAGVVAGALLEAGYQVCVKRPRPPAGEATDRP